MQRPQLLTGAVVLALTATAACNRAETTQEAREAAAEVRTAAARAGETLADGWLTAKVQAKFFADDEIKARYIDVSSNDGTVTLQGFVESDAVRQQALQIARATDGVKQIEDRLLIGQAPQDIAARSASTGAVATSGAASAAPPPGVLDDTTVISLIQAKYFVDPAIKARTVDVSSVNGVVTLRGQVASDAERAQALLLARTTHGVNRVEDSLTVDASLAAPGPAQGSAAAPAPLAASAIPGASSATPAAGTANNTRPAPGSGPAPVGTSGVRTAETGLTSTLEGKLAADAQLKAAGIEVSARDGVVLLQGTVPTAAAKQRALTMARETDGVIQVVDRLTIKK